MQNERRASVGAKNIGSVVSPSGKSYDVKWDERSKDTYVSYAGWTSIGTADSAGDAMRIAEAWLHDK
jgi:type IV secretory pathway TrbF-like protein